MRWLIILLVPLLSFGQNEYYDKLLKLPEKEMHIEITKQIANFQSLTLWNFLKSIEEKGIDLNKFNQELIAKADGSDLPIEIYFLTKILVKQKTDKRIIERILNKKTYFWDKGNWSEKFWILIRSHNLIVTMPELYIVNETGKKFYDIEKFCEEKIKDNSIGNNSLLQVDEVFITYPVNELISTLIKMDIDIKDIQIVPKSESVKLFGKKGSDGVIQILTR